MILERMAKHKADRDSGWTITLVDDFPPLTELTEYTYLGSFSWTLTASKVKLYLKEFAVETLAGWATPAELARDFVHVMGYAKEYRRLTTEQWRYYVENPRWHPLYAKPSVFGDGVYMDLRAAYWSILKVVGWSPDVNPGYWFAIANPVHDFPYPENKLARNCLVSIGIPTTSTVWDGTQIIQVPSRSPFRNFMLHGVVMDVLRGVAHDMVRAGAVYVHTDGYIFRHDDKYKAETVAAEWGLPIGVKHRGLTNVRKAGDYDIGGRTSGIVGMSVSEHLDDLDFHYRAWLKERFSAWAQRLNTG